MKSLIIADVHANWAALEALPAADLVVCAGDMVTFGPQPGAVIDALAKIGARCVRGDEDDAVARNLRREAAPGLESAADETRVWTRSVLTKNQMRWLGELPFEIEVEAGSVRLAATHAYPGVINRYLRPTREELERVARAFPRANIVVVGHTHRSGIWQVGGTTILMPGSVGQSSHGGHASFAQIEGSTVTLRELPYDVDRTIEQIRATPWSASAKESCIRALQLGAPRPYESVLPKDVERRLAVGPARGK
jgi:putative phosphoesterase